MQIVAKADYATSEAVFERPPPIKPKYRKAFVDIICLGMRNIKPLGQTKTSTPFVEFDVGDRSALMRLQKTKPSKKPSSASPNFCQRLQIPCEIPEDKLYAPSVNLRCRDVQLGGWSKPVLGATHISLEDKLPWNPEAGKGKRPSLFDPDFKSYEETKSRDLGARKLEPVEEKENDAEEDVAVSADVVVEVGQGEEKQVESKDEDVEEFMPKYMVGRERISQPVESLFPAQPFESFTMTRGKAKDYDMFGNAISSVSEAGVFKGIVSVVTNPEDAKHSYLLDQILKPKVFCVRLYILRGIDLMPLDEGSKSDPFLRVKLGDEVRDGASEHHADTLNPEFYKAYEFCTTLPGTSQLEIEVWDYDTYTPHDFIVKTTYDLQDLHFQQKWTQMKMHPLERRPLMLPTSSNPQGHLECWVDIIEAKEAKKSKMWDITPPPKQEFEVRAIMWKTRKVVSGDYFTDQSDMYIRCWFESEGDVPDVPQTTDTHWRCKKGKGSFNWRMKWNLALPAKFGRLHLQVWDA